MEFVKRINIPILQYVMKNNSYTIKYSIIIKNDTLCDYVNHMRYDWYGYVRIPDCVQHHLKSKS